MDVLEKIRPLSDKLGGEKVLTDADILGSYCGDSWPLVRKWTTEDLAAVRPACVVRAKKEADVVATLKFATAHALPVFPRAGGSAVTGAAVAASGAIVLDMSRMNRIVDLDEQNGLVTVEAGVLGGELEAWLNERGWTVGHYPQSLHISTVGGWVATRSTGTFSSKYGGIENLVSGLDVIVGDGRKIAFRPVPRAAAGPALMQLFLGAEGSFGVVTRVVLRIVPVPDYRVVTGYVFDDLAQALATVKEGFRAHVVPAVTRLYDATEARGMFRKIHVDAETPLLLVGHEGNRQLAELERDVLGGIARRNGATEVGTEIGDAWLQHRFNAEWFDNGNAGPDMIADSIEVCPVWSELLPLYEAVLEKAGPLCGEFMAHWSHFYSDGCGMYFIFSLKNSDRAALIDTYNQVWSIVMDETVAHGGAISHHHGIGLIRKNRMAAWMGDSMPLMAAVKRFVDPANILVPGRLIPDSA